MVNTNHQEAVMSTTKRTLRTSIAIAAALLALPQAASAIPNGGNNGEPPDPPNFLPTAKFTITPNPALVSSEAVVVRANAAAFPGRGDFFRGGDVVKFDASTSSDPDGQIKKYEWDTDGNGSYESSSTTSALHSRRYTNVGSYDVKLRVTDDRGGKKTIVHTLIVHAPPKAVMTASPTVALVGQTVSYAGGGSSDDNGIAKYQWDLDGDGTFETDTGTTTTASSSYTAIGTRTVKLRVTDVYGATGQVSVDIVVHRAPTAAFTAAPNPAVTDELVTFDGSTSGDDDPIARYEWDLDGDGTFETDTANTPTTTKSYAAPGAVTIRLRVTDSHGVQDVVAQSLTVNPRPVDATAPLVLITPRSAKLGKGGRVTLTIACPAGESRCNGRVDLRSLRGARSAALGGRTFSLLGGESAKVRVQLSRKNRQAVKRLRRLRAQATAVATDAAGNTGTSRAKLVIRR
jgi:PKD repeat protein